MSEKITVKIANAPLLILMKMKNIARMYHKRLFLGKKPRIKAIEIPWAISEGFELLFIALKSLIKNLSIN